MPSYVEPETGTTPSAPPADVPPTTTGGGVIIRLDPPSTSGEGVQIQRVCQYNCTNDARPIHVKGSVRLYRETDLAWFWGLAKPGAVLNVAGALAHDDVVGYYGLNGVLYTVSGSSLAEAGLVAATDWYRLDLLVSPHRKGGQFWFGQSYEDKGSATLPGATVGLGLTLAVVNLDSSRAFLEGRGLFAAQQM